MKLNESWNIIKGLTLVAGVFYAGYLLLCALYPAPPKPTGPMIDYYVVSATVNGHLYSKEAMPDEIYTGFVTFEDGTRLPVSAVTATKQSISAKEFYETMARVEELKQKAYGDVAAAKH